MVGLRFSGGSIAGDWYVFLVCPSVAVQVALILGS
jgi:hypothetical protein